MKDDILNMSEQELHQELLSKGAHAIKSPLTSLITGIQLLASSKEEISPRLHDIIASLEESTIGMKNLVLDIFNALKIICDMNTDDVTLINIHEVVEIARKQVSLKANQVLEVEIAPELYEIYYKNRVIEIVIRALLENASLYSPDDTRIVLSVTKDETNLSIDVSDEGSGINKQEVEKICEPFYRSPMHKTNRIVGTGLGLTIVKNIATKLNGDLIISSKRGEGSTFSVVLPLHQA